MGHNPTPADYDAYCERFENDPRIVAARKRYRADKRAYVVESTADGRLWKVARAVRDELEAKGLGFPKSHQPTIPH